MDFHSLALPSIRFGRIYCKEEDFVFLNNE